MMPYLGLETQTFKNGLAREVTTLLAQGATQGLPILAAGPDLHLREPTMFILAQQHLLKLDQLHQEPTPGNQGTLGPILVPAPLTSILDH